MHGATIKIISDVLLQACRVIIVRRYAALTSRPATCYKHVRSVI